MTARKGELISGRVSVRRSFDSSHKDSDVSPLLLSQTHSCKLHESLDKILRYTVAHKSRHTLIGPSPRTYC